MQRLHLDPHDSLSCSSRITFTSEEMRSIVSNHHQVIRMRLFSASAVIVTVAGIFFLLHRNRYNQTSGLFLVNEFRETANTRTIEFNYGKNVASPSYNTVRVESATRFNLLEDVDQESSTFAADECSQESMNFNRLQQDHPCVIEIIRRRYLHPPADPDVPYVLNAPNTTDPSAGQAKRILKYLGNQTEGFFIECGALDGEDLSNTLYMERTMMWSGVLIEADQTSFGKLLSRRRKSYALPVCLSLQPYPTRVVFKVTYAVGSVQESLTPEQFYPKNYQEMEDTHMITVQCFPLYSILLAIGRTQVDFFSLDVEGHELSVLKTIPWHKVNVKTLSVEWDHVGQQPLIDFMEPQGYYVFGRNEGTTVGADIFFARNDSHYHQA